MSNSAYVSVNSVDISLTGTTGANVSSGSSIVVQLVNPAGVQSWNIACYGVDEITSAASVNATLVQDNTTWTATFTAPSTVEGATMLFNSVTNQGKANQNSFTFGVFVELDGYRLFAGGEDAQSNATVGNAADLNKLVRGVALGGGGGGNFVAGGDLSGTSSDQTVIAIQGNAVSASSPTEGQFLVEGSGSTWKPTTLSGDVTASTGTPGDITVVGLQSNDVKSGVLGSIDDGYVLTWNNSGSQYEALPITTVSGVTLSGVPSTGQIIVATGSTTADWQNAPSGSFSAGGDLTGTSTDQTVNAIQGVVISGTPAAGNGLFATSSLAAAWSAPITISGVSVSLTPPTTNQVLTATSSATASWQTPASGAFTAGGDLTGTF